MKYFIALAFTLGSINLGFSQVSNLEPMYGSGKKSTEHKKMDKEFISSVVEKYGSKEKAYDAHINFGWRYFYNNELETAMKRFNQAWLLDPKHPDSYYGFAALTRSNDQEQSLKYEHMGLEIDPDKKRAAECFQHAANCLEQLGQIEPTIYFYTRLIELNPAFPFYYKKRGFLYSSMDNADKALRDYNKAIELDPKDAMTFNNRAFRHQQDKNLDAALVDYTHAIELDSTYISARLNRALTYWEMDKFNEALTDVNKCIELDTSHAPFYSMKGRILIGLGQMEDACDSFVMALGLGDHSIESEFLKVCTRTIEIEGK